MGKLWQATFGSIPPRATRHRPPPDPARSDAAIDQLIDRSDPRLRLVRHYRRRLRPAMQQALAHIDQLVARIPGAFPVCAQAFSADPRVKAFFSNIDHLRQVYCSSRELHDFFTNPAFSQSSECYALLCMNRDERHVFGIGLENDQIRQDVPQTRVSFVGHQLLSAAPDEPQLRISLRHCLLQGLLQQAGNTLSGGIEQRRRLRLQQRQLHSHLRALQVSSASDSLQRARRQQQQADSRRQLQSVEQQLTALERQLGDINRHLEVLIEGLRQAPRQIRVAHCPLRLTATNVKRDPQHDQDGTLLDLTEVYLGQEAPRIVSLTRYPRSEFQPAGLL